jgi:8-oxo-dGTP pyrophosphatase MutT (NUDIX family)
MSEDTPRRDASRPVRPRRAASLVLLRRDGDRDGAEVLLGRRPRGARFMPGRFVFPGGGVLPCDAHSWHGEVAPAEGDRAERIAARAALRETYEETGMVIGRPCDTPPGDARPPLCEAERAYRAHGLVPDLAALRPIGRAITPTRSPIRFHARFFLAEGDRAHGPLARGEELEEVGWYRLAEGFPKPMSSVTQFMLRQAIAVWRGTARPGLPLYRYVNGAARVDWQILPGEPR